MWVIYGTQFVSGSAFRTLPSPMDGVIYSTKFHFVRLSSTQLPYHLFVDTTNRVLQFNFSGTICTFVIERVISVAEIRSWLLDRFCFESPFTLLCEGIRLTNDSQHFSPSPRLPTINVCSEGKVTRKVMFSDRTAQPPTILGPYFFDLQASSEVISDALQNYRPGQYTFVYDSVSVLERDMLNSVPFGPGGGNSINSSLSEMSSNSQ
jgi:hypothetical protein